MSYSIYIGELRINTCIDEVTEDASYIFNVEPAKMPDAPAFGEALSDFVNERHPAYSTWSDFLRNTDLHHWHNEGGLMNGKDGIPKPITEAHMNEVCDAYDKYIAKHPNIQPCFDKSE